MITKMTKMILPIAVQFAVQFNCSTILEIVKLLQYNSIAVQFQKIINNNNNDNNNMFPQYDSC